MFWQEIHRLDQEVTLEINSWHSALTDPIWDFFSNIPVWIPMYLLIVALVIRRLGWRNGLIIVGAALLAFGFCDQFSNLIKDAVGRVRPQHDPFMIERGIHVIEKGGRSFSFFSAHAANAFSLATCTWLGLRRNDCRRKYRGYAAWMFTWATLVAVSRVFVSRHYLGDILVGALVGAAVGYAAAWLAQQIIGRLSERNSASSAEKE